MEQRKIACLFAASFIGVGLSAAATDVHAKSPKTIVVQAVDPELQRRVSYADLNLARISGQRALKLRIAYTARNLCLDINGFHDPTCQNFAIDSTRGQVQAAIARAERQMAGLAVGPPIAISMVIATQ
jgi:UrcA family protein